MRNDIVIGNISDVGRVRDANEDYFGFYEPEDEATFADKGRIVIVADGMGGAAGGYTASRIVVEEVRRSYLASDEEDPLAALREAHRSANSAVRRFAAEHPELRGMGSTCTTLVLRGRTAQLAHVGDSRAYLVRDGTIEQLTEDHSRVGRMVRDGILTEEEAREHPERNVILRSVGAKDTLEVDTSLLPEPMEPGDQLVLCSDGLHGLVTDEEIRSAALSFLPQEACRRLVDLANQRGGHDNITVQIVGLPPLPAAARAGASSPTAECVARAPSREARSPAARWLRTAVLVVGCVAVGFALHALLLGEGNDVPQPAGRSGFASGPAEDAGAVGLTPDPADAAQAEDAAGAEDAADATDAADGGVEQDAGRAKIRAGTWPTQLEPPRAASPKRPAESSADEKPEDDETLAPTAPGARQNQPASERVGQPREVGGKDNKGEDAPAPAPPVPSEQPDPAVAPGSEPAPIRSAPLAPRPDAD